VLAPYAGKSVYADHGQRITQAASGVFLGWTHGDKGRRFFVRQLRDVNITPMCVPSARDGSRSASSGEGREGVSSVGR
jgi:hypothetical protein